jgi:hypothetical protein
MQTDIVFGAFLFAEFHFLKTRTVSIGQAETTDIRNRETIDSTDCTEYEL